MSYSSNHLEYIIKDIILQKESIVLNQLNDLIAKGILVVDQGNYTLVRDSNSSKIHFHQEVKIVSKEKEYIEKLEAENKALKEKLESQVKFKSVQDEIEKLFKAACYDFNTSIEIIE